jgi:hypothetical protein
MLRPAGWRRHSSAAPHQGITAHTAQKIQSLSSTTPSRPASIQRSSRSSQASTTDSSSHAQPTPASARRTCAVREVKAEENGGSIHRGLSLHQ